MNQTAKYCLYLLVIFGLSGKVYAQTNLTEENNFIKFAVDEKLSDLLSEENIAPYLNYFNRNERLRWQVVVPVNQQLTNSKGLLVYISPEDSGELYEMWKPVIKEKNLIWIAADKAGNNFAAQRRVLQALLAVQLAAKRYPLDGKRIYLAGFSGGGRVASMMAPLYPEVFTGSIFMGGANYWGSKKPEKFSLMQNKSYVFINGANDFNLKESRGVSKKFLNAGLNNIEFFEVPNLGHLPPDAKSLSVAIDFLDAASSIH